MPNRTLLHRKCSCGGNAGPTGECEECRKKRLNTRHLKPKPENRNELLAPSTVAEALRSPGQPLDQATRALMESRLGYNFGNVRVHLDGPAADSAQAVTALAYTVGKHVVFGARQYNPYSSAGLKLIAHELTHVAQQQSMEGQTTAGLRVAPAESPMERQAKAADSSSLAHPRFEQASTPQVQRAPADSMSGPVRFRGDTLPYRESTELADCIRILGEGSAAYCRDQVLGEPLPTPTQHQLPGITTPLPTEVELNRDRTASLNVNQINVVFEPDASSTDPGMANRAETTFNLSASNIHYRAISGKVTQFTGPGPVEVRIRTTYGPGASSGVKSGYGRGTTPEDITSGRTTLGFHEGHHGQDYLEFLTAHPFPRFIGNIRMTTAQFEEAMTSFMSARDQFRDDMKRFSEERTDCVGKTIDVSNAANGVQTSICRQIVTPSRP